MTDYNEILLKLGTSQQPLEFVTTPGRAFVLIAQLQLALRHPDNIGGSAVIAHELIDHLTDAICSIVPEARELIEQGRNPAYDTTRAYFDDEFPRPSREEIQDYLDNEPNDYNTGARG